MNSILFVTFLVTIFYSTSSFKLQYPYQPNRQLYPPKQTPFTQSPVSNQNLIANNGNSMTLISRSSRVDRKENESYRQFVVTNIETYQMPSNDILIRSRVNGFVDWLVKPVKHFISPSPASLASQSNQSRLRKRDLKDQMEGQMEGQMGGQMKDQMEKQMANNPFERLKQLYEKAKKIIEQIKSGKFSTNSEQ